MNPTKPIIEFKHISLDFGHKTIFNNFSFAIHPQEKVVIFGKSGTGKSTLLRLILGFEQPDRGIITVRGKTLSPRNIDWIRRQIAYVDQDVMMGQGTARDSLAEYLSFKANQNILLKESSLLELLSQFELEASLLDKNITELSGGERQRVALVVALLLKRPILVLDEVTSSLDPVSKDIVISRLLEEKHATLLIITHDQEWQSQAKVKVFNFKDKIWM